MKISKEQAKLFALSIIDEIRCYIKERPTEYQGFT